ncbi:secreted Ly-6/uPAR domain-containing protein 2 [Manis javanica]|uniref:secreted Ly-6/uPAR domain-containing protein 2 n=1 Tax=Manis javanica TaxID=9974 RepID=UPI003C6D5ACB
MGLGGSSSRYKRQLGLPGSLTSSQKNMQWLLGLLLAAALNLELGESSASFPVLHHCSKPIPPVLATTEPWAVTLVLPMSCKFTMDSMDMQGGLASGGDPGLEGPEPDPDTQQVRSRAGTVPAPRSGREPEQGAGGRASAWRLGAGYAGSSKPQGTCRAFLLSTPEVHSSFKDLSLVTKMCYSGCPDISTLGLGPSTSIACCQASLCSHD